MQNDTEKDHNHIGAGLTKGQENADKEFTKIVLAALENQKGLNPISIAEYVDESKTERNMNLYDLYYDSKKEQPGIPNILMRTYNCLRRAGCESLADILDIIEWDLLSGIRNFNELCVENAIDICRHFCPNETEKRIEIANINRDRLLKTQETSNLLLHSEKQQTQDLLNKPISDIIPQEYLELYPLKEIDLKIFRDLCDVIANGGDYHTELWGERNLFSNSVSIYLIRVLQIYEALLIK